jgi:hypothetical protein
MLKRTVPAVVAAGLAVALIAAVLVLVLGGGAGSKTATAGARGGSSTATSTTATSAAAATPPPGLARYRESSPHVASSISVYAPQGGVAGAPLTPPSEQPPVSAAAFRAPVRAYKRYSDAQLAVMLPAVARLRRALVAGDRGAAQAAWRSAYADYLRLGAVYLEGPVADLDAAIDGRPGGPPGGTASPHFTGLHRIELGLWTGQAPASLVSYADRLTADVTKLRGALAQVGIDPLDYATRAHEILEDAQRDLLSGTDVPWSGEGVLGTAAGLDATVEVINTLRSLLGTREQVLPVVDADLAGLRATLAALRRAHGGSLPTNDQLTQQESGRLAASLGQALEGLAQVPGALETTSTPPIPAIPSSSKGSAP